MHTVKRPVRCSFCPLQNCPGLRPLNEKQIAFMERFKRSEVAAARGEVIVQQGSEKAPLLTVLEGLLIRYRLLDDGRRQIVNFMFPGDLIGLQGVFHEPLTHSVEALLPSRFCVFDRNSFFDLMVEQPELGYDVTWLAAKEENALEEHIVALGRRSARERVAYLAVWLLDRALGACMADESNRLAVTITQSQIADMLGLSLVHTNRTIKSLERDGLVIWRQAAIQVPNMKAAKEYAQFEHDPGHSRPFI